MKICYHNRILVALMLLSIVLLSGCSNNGPTSQVASESNDGGSIFDDDPNRVTMYFFWGDGCPYCETQKPFIAEWKEKYPELVVKEFEVYYVRENQAYYSRVAEVYGMRAGPVPVTFLGDKHWIGFAASMAPQIEAKIQQCISEGCESPGTKVLNSE